MNDWQSRLERWVSAGVIDAATGERIRDFEARHGGALQPERATRWPVIIAITFRCVMVGAGGPLFVAAHWDDLSPGARFSLVLVMVAVFHLAGAAFWGRNDMLATALHGVGTASLGAGIFLAGQIFNLQEHWPGGLLLWALGAWVAYLLLHDWTQAALAALLTPMWLGGAWLGAPGVLVC